MLKNLKSLFIIEEKESSGFKAKTRKAAPPPAKDAPVKAENKQGDPGKVRSKFTNVLLEAMNKANWEGFDYLEYKKSLQSLAKMPMDEKTRYQSAFAMAQTMGVSPQHLLDTAQHYIQVLQQEEYKFERALNKQQDKQIESKKQELQQLEKLIQQKAEQIKKLTKEIEAHQKQSKQVENEIQDSTVKIESTKNDFIASFNALVSQIHQDVTNMEAYLK